jgi:hypothetical protein
VTWFFRHDFFLFTITRRKDDQIGGVFGKCSEAVVVGILSLSVMNTR